MAVYSVEVDLERFGGFGLHFLEVECRFGEIAVYVDVDSLRFGAFWSVWTAQVGISLRCQDVKMSRCKDVNYRVHFPTHKLSRCQDVKLHLVHFPIHKISRCQDVNLHLVHFHIHKISRYQMSNFT